MDTIQNYTITEKLDETPSSEVYRSQLHDTDKTFIIKVLKSTYPSSSEIARFKQEYELIRKIDFKGVIRTYDLLEHGGKFALVMEDFQGISLNKAFSKNNIDISTFLEVAISLSETLGNLHSQNIIHMDIKPRNILVNPKNYLVKITDFGISAQMTRENREIYNPDIIKGSLAYLSPEQTGRMNRHVDNRSDLYSLGVTFYEILTGTLPFISLDPMEMIHAHLAKKPIPPSYLNPDLPEVVSDIILKLMSKAAEDRYQNSFGLMADLQECLEQLKTKGKITPFNLGRKDVPLTFTLPQKLYGRDKEIKLIENVFDSVSKGSKGIVFVSGLAGIGKTALINEMQNPIIEKKGFFISGKYEQNRQDVPYSAIIKAFEKLITQLLSENQKMLVKWKEKLLTALSNNEAIITQMIPDVAHIIGFQPNISDLESEELKNKFPIVFKNFTKVFAQKDHPLVMFLDDLQWADLSSLQLLKSLISDPDMTYMMIILSFRNNEVLPDHPFSLFADELKKNNLSIIEIPLHPLQVRDTNQILDDFFKCSEEQSKPLADLIHKKTNGNPFFINQFMKTLYENELLHADPETGWHWDIEKIKDVKITDNVVDLLSDKIVKLRESTGEILKISACIGNTFDLERLSVILHKPMETIWEDAKHAIDEGYIEITGDILKFQHDRIREAAYNLVPEDEREKIHYHIGRYKLENTDPDDLPTHVFYIADHLNQAGNIVIQKNEQNEIARLNLLAGEKAIYSAAYASAISYLEHGIALLGEDSWTKQYDLSLKLHEGVVAAACLGGQYDLMDKYRTVALQKVKRLPDQVRFYEFHILAYIAQDNLVAAVETGVSTLKKLGITFPKKINTMHIVLNLIRVKLALRGKKIENLLYLPEMTDPKILSIVRILAKISTAAYQSNLELSLLMDIEHLLIAIKYGNTPGSSVAYSSYGVLLCAILEDFDNGYKFGKLGLNILEKYNNVEFKAQVLTSFHGFIRHWKHHVTESLTPLLEGFKIGKDAGMPAHGAYCLFVYCASAFLAGKELFSLDEEITKCMQAVSQLNQEHPLVYFKIVKQMVLNLKGDADNPCRLIGDAYNEDEMLPIHHKNRDQSALAYFYCHKMFLTFLFGNITEAKTNAAFMKKFFNGTKSSLNDPRYYLFSGLIGLALYPGANFLEKKRILRQVSYAGKKLKKYAYHCPENSAFAFYLLTAEEAGVLKDYRKATLYYDKAITSTKKSGFIHYEALVNELAAKFYLANGHKNIARLHIHEAIVKYRQWGALAKVKHLDILYPDFIVSSDTIFKSGANYMFQSTETLLTDESRKNLDFSTVTKASEAIFGEIVLSKLLQRLMGILIENAGAERGAIILKDKDLLLVEAEGTLGTEKIDVLKSIPIEVHQGLSSAIVSYVARTKKIILLNNAAGKGEFTKDPYIMTNRPKSILCMPVLNQGRLSAILYLENNLATDVFTSKRLKILNMLSSQIAVAIDNAKIYENLEQKVEERTEQLKKAQEENLKKAHRAGMADIAKETLHNVGNILNSIKTTADIMNMDTHESALTGLISANRLLRKHMTHLEEFITNDPKGKKLIDYYLALEDLFLDERMKKGKNLQRLQKKITDIANVIHTLQSHIEDKDSYMEYIQLMEEVRFVLETKREGLIKSNIKIREKYDDVPMVKAQKSKIAHILDNLIINAKEAMENTTDQEKVISVEIEHKNKKVLLHICDNGEGISEENIKRIFFQGFTTKQGRTGHNLHNCANNMSEMGGKISAESNGKGKGTTFTLEFPT